MQYPHHIPALCVACPSHEFVGRANAFDALDRLGRDAVGGLARCLAVAGPHGAGKSELLRQWTLRVLRRESEADQQLLPIYLDLTDLLSGARGLASEEPLVWQSIYRSVVAQTVGLERELPESFDVPGRLDPYQLTGCCYERNMSQLAPFVEISSELCGDQPWRTLLETLRAATGLPEPVLVINGGSDGKITPHITLWQDRLRRGAHFQKVAVLCEYSGFSSEGIVTCERLELTPLSLAEGLELTTQLGKRAGWSAANHCFQPILERLGPWPGWVAEWVCMVMPDEGEFDRPVRRCEEAYLKWLAEGVWSLNMRSLLDRAVGMDRRERLLRLLQTIYDNSRPISSAQIVDLLHAPASEVETIMGRLLSLGLVRRRAELWLPPVEGAMQHWLQLQLADSEGNDARQQGQLKLLRQLLSQPRSDGERSAESSQDVASLLATFTSICRCQTIPEVLLQYEHYHEALGELGPAARVDAVMNSTATRMLPEAIRLAPWGEPRSRQDAAIYQLLCYRQGKYQRSHEETWLILDFSASPSLTSPEIDQALERVRAIKEQLGAGRYSLWIIAGERISPEAQEQIRLMDCFCSDREQLKMLVDHLRPTPPRKPPEQQRPASGRVDRLAALDEIKKKLSAMSAEEKDEPIDTVTRAREAAKATRPRQQVIDASEANVLPEKEVNRMTLPARNDSEMIAAVAVEKIAIHAGFPAAEAGKVKTAVLEGVLNAIEHSANEEKPILLEVRLTPEQLEVLIENEGESFDPLAVESPDPRAKLKSKNKRGWGMKLMRRFMDEVGYEPCAHGTRLKMTKRRAPQREQQDLPGRETGRG